MKTLYLECAMGAAGDMLTAALLELIDDKQAFLERMNALGLPGVHVAAENAEKCGIRGTHMKVTVDGVEEEAGEAHEQNHAHEPDHGHAHPHEHAHHGHDHHAHASAADIAFAMERLFEAGARDVYTQAIGMKKSRPGVLLSVICMPEDADRLAKTMMENTTTLGIRRQDMGRYLLERHVETVHTVYGDVRVKRASGMGVERAKPEYEDVAALAKKHGVPLETIRKGWKG